MAHRHHHDLARAAGAFVLAGLAAAPALAQADMSPQSILERTENAQGVFEMADGDAIRHVQSGLICPAAYADISLWALAVYDSPQGPGADVGCDYGRRNADGLTSAKLTVFAIKFPPDATVDDAFAYYQREVAKAYPEAEVLGPAITFEGEELEKYSEVRSEEYSLFINGVRHSSDLIVASIDGWIVEIRGSFRTEVTEDDAPMAIADLASPSIALTEAMASMGQ